MKNLICIIRVCAFFLIFFKGMEGFAQSDWECRPQDYRYDMSIYAALCIDGKVVNNYSDYIIGAFSSNEEKAECRGIALEQNASQQGVSYNWLYLRIRSNEESGERILLRLYDKATSTTKNIVTAITFEKDQQIGTPSNPLIINLGTKGDVNDDGAIDIMDVLATQSIMKGQPESYNLTAADANNDGQIDIMDVLTILEIMKTK